jgi:hypothetical protein
MAKARQYWIRVWVDGTLVLRTSLIEAAYQFWLVQFPQLPEDSEVPSEIPQILAQQCRNGKFSIPAEACLQCFVSHQIKAICISLEQRFGIKHGFVAEELFPLVLYSERGSSDKTSGLITHILETWDPTKNSNLTSWVSALFRSDREVRQFLFEHGVEQLSDWLILCRTTQGRLQRHLAAVNATADEIAATCQLLDQFHQVYRADYLSQAQKRYQEPTKEQLQRIAQGISLQVMPSTAQILNDLKILAQALRRERTKTVQKVQVEEIKADSAVTEADEQTAFLTEYAQYLNHCLANGVKQGIDDCLQRYEGRSTPKAIQRAQLKRAQFLQALSLFYCRAFTTVEIANRLDLGHQATACRLLNLKVLHENIARHTVVCLMDCVPSLARNFGAAVTDQQFLALLNEEVVQLIDEGSSKHRTTSLFARVLCQLMEGYPNHE